MFDEFLSPLLTTRWGHRTGLGVMLVMAVLVCVALIKMPMTWWSDIKLSRAPLASHDNHVQAANTTAKLIATIPSWHLFGKREDHLPITSLQLHLVGVSQSPIAKFSSVIISEGGQPGKVYQVGDTLLDGVKIYAITKDGVILDNGGRLETLPLQRQPLQFQGMPKSLLDLQGE